MSVTGFFHAGVTVKDIDVALGFYRDGLRLEVAFLGESAIQYARRIWNQDPERVRVAFLKVPGTESFVELFEFRGSSATRRAPGRPTTARATCACSSTTSTRSTPA
jgi:hypothetical protein